jgi:hypothetical protein
MVVNKVGMCASNEHGQPWRDNVHRALEQAQQAQAVHGIDGANRWKQEQSMQRAQVVLMWYEYLVLFLLNYYLNIICNFTSKIFLLCE